MTSTKKEPSKLTWMDLQEHPIWDYQSTPEDEWMVVPITIEAVKNLPSVIIGTTITLADGTSHGAMLDSVSLAGPIVNEHFLRLRVWHEDQWIDLARYHDYDYASNGPEGFAQNLGKTVTEVFPITYDLRHVLKSNSSQLTGEVRDRPSKMLNKPEIRQLSLLLVDPSLPWPFEQ